MSPLMFCCIEGDSEIAKLLLSSHVNPDLQKKVMGLVCISVFVSVCVCVCVCVMCIL